MPEEKNGNILGRFAEVIRDELHNHDVRLTKLETTNKVIWAAVGIILIVAALVVSIIALR